MRTYLRWTLQDMNVMLGDRSAFGLIRPWVENNGKVAECARGLGYVMVLDPIGYN